VTSDRLWRGRLRGASGLGGVAAICEFQK
jgi:hypothetical protein